jgi:preprotein translocase subunit SecY
MIESVRKAFEMPDLRKKIIFTFLVLIVYRAGSQIPIPNVDTNALSDLLSGRLGTSGGGIEIIQFLNLLSGGALAQLSVLAMGVYPYITASIIMQLLTPMVPYLDELSKEGEQGRNKINQYTYWLSVPLAALQAYGQVTIVQQSFASFNIVTDFGFRDYPLSTFATIVAMTAGSMFAVWLGEQITERGIGNGISIIIFGGIVAELPGRVWQFIELRQIGQLVAFTVITVLTILVIVVVNEGQRRIPVQYGKRQKGNRVYQGQSTHIPLKVNSSGMIPLIFAQSIMIFPGSIANFFTISENAVVASVSNFVVEWFSPRPEAWPYWLLYFVMVAAFTFFYTDVIFKQQRLAESLQKQNGYIQGLRPGRITDVYLTSVLRRITLVGALFLGAIAILPWFVQLIPGLSSPSGEVNTLLITSAGLLIVVGVALDTIRQLDAQLMMRNLKGFVR